MSFTRKLYFLWAALSFYGTCYARKQTPQDILPDVQARADKENGGESSNLTSLLLSLSKYLAGKVVNYTDLLFKKNNETSVHPKPPNFFQLFQMFTSATMFAASMKLHKPNTSCYDSVGCFYIHQNMSLPYGGPYGPDAVGTVFYFFNNESRSTQDLNSTMFTLKNWTLQSMRYPSKPLNVITHGFTGNITTPWMMPLVEALLNNVNCNVIVVDWQLGAEGPNYPTAAANTPMVGVETSLLLQKIITATNCTLMPANITLIGFSLGAHVMGFAGRHFYNATKMKLGRIAGLDPAGMLFEGTTAALSRQDAEFVDVIHTNIGDIKTFQLGLNSSIGHVDFYPNGGSSQPNCSKSLAIDLSSLGNISSPTGLLISIMDSMACSHYRAPTLFTESITNPNCNFTSYPCPKGWANYDNCSKRFKNNETVKGLMGYYSLLRKGRGDQYLKTNATSPYCIQEN